MERRAASIRVTDNRLNVTYTESSRGEYEHNLLIRLQPWTLISRSYLVTITRTRENSRPHAHAHTFCYIQHCEHCGAFHKFAYYYKSLIFQMIYFVGTKQCLCVLNCSKFAFAVQCCMRKTVCLQLFVFVIWCLNVNAFLLINTKVCFLSVSRL